MEWVNITAKSLPEAIDLALDNLGVDESEAEIEVVEEPKQGLFGRTRGNARVRARVKPKESRPKEGRGRNRRRRSEGSGGGKGSQPRNRRRNNGPWDGGKSDDGGERKQESQSRDGRSGGQGGGRGGGRSGNGGAKKENKQRSQAKAEGKRSDDSPVKEATMEEVTNEVEQFLQGLSTAMGYEDGVRIDEDGDGGIIGVVEGQHGLLVGPKGRTLEAVQELTRVVAQRSAPSDVRIKVDVGGYRTMRSTALVSFAESAADQALTDGKERALEPMNSVDRKIVHDALSGRDGIETRSDGTDPHRRVVVVPVGYVAPADDGEADAGDDSLIEEVSADEPAEAPVDERSDGEALNGDADTGSSSNGDEADGDADAETTEAAIVD